MKLMTKELLGRIPPLYTNENETDPIVVCKFFTPDGAWTWYVIEGATREDGGCGFGKDCLHKPLSEYDPEHDDILFFGYVVGDEPEFGYFTLGELKSIRGGLGLRVERDLYFKPCRISTLPVW